MSNSKIPTGFKKMDIEITMSQNEFDVFKKHILRLLLRDYYVLYSVKKYSSFYKVFFYCQPSVESSLTYRIGCYNQAMFQYYTQEDIIKSEHVVHENYIESCLIETIESTIN
jgi:hypothetical protein